MPYKNHVILVIYRVVGDGTKRSIKMHVNDTISKRSASKLGVNNPRWGKPVSESTRQKLRAALSGRTFSDEHRRKLCENHADFSGTNAPFYGRNILWL